MIDDGSTDNTRKLVADGFKNKLNLQFLTGDGTLQWGGATHLGIEAAMSEPGQDDVLVLMNNDSEIPRDLLSKAKELLNRYPGSSLGPLVADIEDRNRIRNQNKVNVIEKPLVNDKLPSENSDTKQDQIIKNKE